MCANCERARPGVLASSATTTFWLLLTRIFNVYDTSMQCSLQWTLHLCIPKHCVVTYPLYEVATLVALLTLSPNYLRLHCKLVRESQLHSVILFASHDANVINHWTWMTLTSRSRLASCRGIVCQAQLYR